MLMPIVNYFAKKYSRDERYLRQFRSIVDKINALEPAIQSLSDVELRSKTDEFKERIAQGATIESLLVEAFAVVREASLRTLGMRHFDVQMIGGIVLHKAMIAEMKTGEGKTLVATLPIYLNALAGQGVHLVTVNDYLAQRDATQMGHIYNFLGLSVGCIVQDLTNQQRYDAYHCDITYGTNNEFGFDYLRDNMKMQINEMCQRTPYYAIVDEVGSILIDEARTPLIISGPAEESSELYVKVNEVIGHLNEDDYEKEEKHKSISFTDKGFIHVEHLVRQAGLIKGDQLFQPINTLLVHHLNQALKARMMFQKEVDYIVKNDEVIIIDEFTGRMMKGRRYSDGLHQALEAKEGVPIEAENQTLASITFQNYFRMYPRLAGMTGTAKTEAQEFEAIYRLPVMSIPTNVNVKREDMDDQIFLNFEEKERSIVDLVQECYRRKQPVLVGTASIEKSEVFSHALRKAGIPHHVLNARQHEQEASIIAEAGAPGAVTIATNMAGRGTDIKLGGNVDVRLAKELAGVECEDERARITQNVREEIALAANQARKAGGLFVIGTERHESRRIDNQLRGRSGRQGDPGASKFFISLDDDLMRIFGPNLQLMQYSLQKTEKSDEGPIMHPWITRAIEKAQQRVEAQHFDTRKHLLKYAEVMNSQRIAVYDMRLEVMKKEDLHEQIQTMVHETIHRWIDEYTDKRLLPDHWSLDILQQAAQRVFNIQLDLEAALGGGDLSIEFIENHLQDNVQAILKEKENAIGEGMMRYLEKAILSRTLDEVWRNHLHAIDHLREGIHLQAYGQKNPLNEYKNQAFLMFKSMVGVFHEKVLSFLCHLDVSNFAAREETEEPIESLSDDSDLILDQALFLHPDPEPDEDPKDSLGVEPSEESERIFAPVGRNQRCPCGSGERYKFCHGRLFD